MTERRLLVEDAVKVRQIVEARIAPGGEYAAVIVQAFDVPPNRVVTRLLALHLADGAQRDLGLADERQSQVAWSPDGRRLAFVSQTPSAVAIVALDLETDERRTVVSGPSGLLAPRWSPDCKRIAFLAFGPDRLGRAARPAPDTELVATLPARAGMVDLATGWLRKLWVVDAGGGEPLQLTEGPFEDGNSAAGGDLVWTPDGCYLLFTADRTAGWREHLETAALHRLTLADGSVERLTPDLGRAVRPAISPDGRRVAYLGMESVAGPGLLFQRLFVLDLETGDRRCVSGNVDRALGTTHTGEVDTAPVWCEDGGSLLTIRCDGGSANVVRLDVRTGEAIQVTSGLRTVQSLTAGPEARRLLYTVAEPTRPAVLRVLEDGCERTVLDPNADWLDGVAVVQPEPLMCPRDGLEIPYWLLLPPGEARVPAIVEIHGGPNNQFSNTFYFDQQLWAAHGYAVIYGNPRGSYGYSLEFYNGCVGDLVGEDACDVLAMLDHAAATHPRIDVGVAAVTGYSYGGYMTNQIVTITDRFRAAVSGAGITDLVSWVATADIGRWFEAMYLGGPASARRQHYAERSPVLQAGRVRTPLLIFHGERDTRVPIAQAEELLYALLEHGVEAALLRLPGDDHGSIRRIGVGGGSPSHQLAVRRAVLEWFDRHLGMAP